MSPTAQPPYVNYGSRVSAPPPVECTEGSFLGLVVNGDENAISALAAEVLNGPANGTIEYRTLTSQMFILTGRFGKVTSRAPGFTGWGSVAESHLSIWVPLAAGRKVAGIFVPHHLAVWVPYIFVDNPLSYAGGREDYGYPKAMGRFDPEDGVGDPTVLEAFGGDFGPQQQAHWVKLLEISRVSAGGAGAKSSASSSSAASPVPPPPPAPGWRAGKQLIPKLLAPKGADATALAFDFTLTDLLNEILTAFVRQVSLKQLRDAGSADEACYQAIIEAAVTATELKWQLAADQWKLKVEQVQSHPLQDDLGLGTQQASLALNLILGMEIEPGQIVAP